MSRELIEAAEAALQALLDLGACPDPDCGEANCLRAMPRLKAALAQARQEAEAGARSAEERCEATCRECDRLTRLDPGHRHEGYGACAPCITGALDAERQARQRAEAEEGKP